jgi:hypothetical protein
MNPTEKRFFQTLLREYHVTPKDRGEGWESGLGVPLPANYVYWGEESETEEIEEGWEREFFRDPVHIQESEIKEMDRCWEVIMRERGLWEFIMRARELRRGVDQGSQNQEKKEVAKADGCTPAEVAAQIIVRLDAPATTADQTGKASSTDEFLADLRRSAQKNSGDLPSRSRGLRL